MYKVKKEDIIGDIKDFPIEVVQLMLQRQYEQCQHTDIKIFQKHYMEGFNWSKTKEGYFFWQEVIFEHNFDLFFKQYPMEKILTISLGKAREIFNKDNCSEDMKELLLSNFTKEELIEEKLPKTWREFCNNYNKQNGEAWVKEDSSISSLTYTSDRSEVTDKNMLPDVKTAKSILALCQLIQLRDCYNDGWKPDWSKGELKFIIKYFKNSIIVDSSRVSSHILSFKTERLRDKFFDNFRDIIEKAKELI